MHGVAQRRFFVTTPCRVVLYLYLVIFLIGARYPMILDTANPNPNLPPLGVTMYALGRFMLPVPTGLQISGSSFKINAISIDEMNWKKGVDRSEYFKSLLSPIRDAEKNAYIRRGHIGPSTQGGWADKDISNLCGHPARLLCYRNKTASHNIDVHIALPELILRLIESRTYEIGNECLDMEEPILNLLKHYRSGSRNVDPDSFFCVTGRFEGMKTWYEQINIGADTLGNTAVPQMHLEVGTYLFAKPDVPPKSFMGAIGVARSVGIDIQFLRSQRRVLAGMDGLEEIFIMSETKNGKVRSELTARWKFQGVGGDHDKPNMDIELTCHPDGKAYALRVWDAVMRNFTTVREFYGRRS